MLDLGSPGRKSLHTSHKCTAQSSGRLTVGPHGAAATSHLSSIPRVDHGLITIEIETVERTATHSSIMFRSTRLGASSERESGWLDSLAG